MDVDNAYEITNGKEDSELKYIDDDEQEEDCDDLEEDE